MKSKIIGIILTLGGCFLLYDAAQAVHTGRITRNGEQPILSQPLVVERGKPGFGQEVVFTGIGGAVFVGLGIVCLFRQKRN